MTRRGNRGKLPQLSFPTFPPRLEIRPTTPDSHISTAPTVILTSQLPKTLHFPEGEAGVELVDDLPWGETSLVRIGASQVEVELVEGSLGQELGAAGEGFQVEELVFDEAAGGMRSCWEPKKVTARGKPEREPSFCNSPMNSPPLSVCQVTSGRWTPQRWRWLWRRWANKALAPAERRSAKARNCKPLRPWRAVYWMTGKPRRFIDR